MKKFGIFILGCFLFVSFTAGAADTAEESACSVETTSGTVEGHDDSALDASAQHGHIHWDFITCVHDNHECYHEAQHHGFPHYATAHDHTKCGGHAHLACYGGHH